MGLGYTFTILGLKFQIIEHFGTILLYNRAISIDNLMDKLGLINKSNFLYKNKVEKYLGYASSNFLYDMEKFCEELIKISKLVEDVKNK